MKVNTVILLLIFNLIFFAQSVCGKTTIPDIKNLPHPRILLPEKGKYQLVQNISNDSVWSVMQQNTLKACDQLLTTAPLERKIEGIRMLSTSREALYRIFMLSYAFRTTENNKYAERAKAELLAVCQYQDWNPSHFLDVAEMTMAVSIGYDWLYNTLDKESQKLIKDAILEKGLNPSLDSKYNTFLERDNNWNQVCNTAMAYGAVAIMEDQPRLAKELIERSVKSIRQPMKRYGPDGAYPEGYGYWHYGTTYNVMLLALLEQIYGTDFGLSDIPGFTKSAYYIMHMISPTLQPFNFGDSDSGIRLNTSMFWFAKKMNDPALINYEVNYLLNLKKYNYEQYSRMLPSIFIFGHNFKLSETNTDRLPLTFVAKNETPVSLMRTKWGAKNAIYVGIKGGLPSDNTHNHLDQGSFVIEVLGVRWAIDLGPQDYASLEKHGISLWDKTQNSQCWTIFRYNNFAHNVFSINDKLFDVNGRAEIKSYKNTPKLKETALDLSPLYDGQLAYASRNIAIVNEEYIEIKDLVRTNAEPANLTWRMLTKAKVVPTGGGFFLIQDGKSVFLSIPAESEPFVTPATPTNDFDAPNPGVSIIGYKTKIAPKETKTLTVRLFPQTIEKTMEICDRVAGWQIKNQISVKHHALDWTNGAWYKGLSEWAKETNNETYFDFLKAQGERHGYNVYYRPYHADDICVSQMYLDLYKRYGDKDFITHTIERLDYVVKNPSSAPLLKTHPKGRDERWSWCDALFMAPPVYAELYTMTGNKKYAEFMDKEFKECTDSLYDKGAKLYFRDCSKINLREPNGEKQFWARGNGWVLAGIPLILDNLPKDYHNRQYYINLFKDLAEGVLKTQDERGSWHASLLDSDSYPLPENSASAFFCYGMAWGIRNGLLDSKKYMDPMLRAWATLCNYVHEDGKMGYIQPVGHEPRPADENTTDVYGVGAFLLAGSEILKLEKSNQNK
ncbi:glycoside hydrolase family 88 protein [Dysgonomonas sp. BGC7]|uniref:glycoside hydrolase family 88 protein n=1 Tax=Dysgonomonas sp. BGC7 TaxID=1658008 RepID=UPI000682D100|nr:glycoside hydrolase family 88 protein [Dysgonomonas sp. BGC7]MBD8387742.1 glycoside hydrolase family 88 protein [Dysgonomonas sp. BGC7]